MSYNRSKTLISEYVGSRLDVSTNCAHNLAAHRRALLATNTSASNFRPLAARDDRLDPFDHFNHYRKGLDIKSKHYWGVGIVTLRSSGIPFFLFFCN